MMMEQYGYEETISVVDDLGDLMQAGQLFSDDRTLADFTPHTCLLYTSKIFSKK